MKTRIHMTNPKKGREARSEVKWILEEMISNLSASCKRKEVDYTGMGEDLLNLYQELIKTHYYHDTNSLKILHELETKLKEIKKWKAIDYNKEIASHICQYLKKQTNSLEKVSPR